jgi:hypothetical protein
VVIGVPLVGGLGPESGRVVLFRGSITGELFATCPKCSTPSSIFTWYGQRDFVVLMRCECGRTFVKDARDYKKLQALVRVVGDDLEALQGFFDEHAF